MTDPVTPDNSSNNSVPPTPTSQTESSVTTNVTVAKVESALKSNMSAIETLVIVVAVIIGLSIVVPSHHAKKHVAVKPVVAHAQKAPKAVIKVTPVKSPVVAEQPVQKRHLSHKRNAQRGSVEEILGRE